VNLPTYPKYRRSGISWLADIPAHWDVATVRRLCTIKKRIAGALGYDVLSITQRGIKVKDTDSNDGQLSMDYSKYQLVDVGDFAMNHMDLLTGWVDISPFEGVTSPDYRVFATSCQQISDPRYLLYLFQMGYENKILFAFGQGSSQLGRWRLPRQAFNAFQLPVPEIAEQRRIVAFLDNETRKIDALIAEQQRLIELLKEKRQAVISHAVTKGLNPDAPMKPSGVEWLGDVPVHWKLPPLYARYSIELGKMLDEDKITGKHLTPYLRNTDVQWNRVNIADLPEMDIAPSERERYTVMSGDLLVCEGGEVGRAAVVTQLYDVLGYQKALHRLRPKHVDDLPRFMYYMFCCASHQGVFAANGNLSTIAHLTGEALRRYRFPKPPIDEQDLIVRFLETEESRIDELLDTAGAAIALLQERRTALISAAVTGKIDVRNHISSEAA